MENTIYINDHNNLVMCRRIIIFTRALITKMMKNNSPLTKSILIFDASGTNRKPHIHVVPCKLSVRWDPGIVTV
jgi:hypothetical protein